MEDPAIDGASLDALHGIRVVDCSVWYVGPEGTAVLGDLGAEVIHVEGLRGDYIRGFHSFNGNPLGLPGGRNALCEHHNRNKKSLCVDLKNPAGQQIIYRLIEKSDVFVTNFRQAAVARLGLDYQTLVTLNPQLIYVSSSALGNRGPLRGTPGLDRIAQAYSGIMLGSGEPNSAPTWVSDGIGDAVGAFTVSMGVLMALVARERLHIGQEVTVSQLAGLMKLQASNLMPNLLTGATQFRHDSRRPDNPLYNLYQCADGRWIVLALLSEDEWGPFCQATGAQALASDPRFATAIDRKEHAEVLVSLLDGVFAERTAEGWVALFKAADLLLCIVNDVSDLPNDPQVLANEYVVEYDHPALGRIKMLGSPVQLSKTPARLRMPAPMLGEHTEEILSDVCGYDWDEIARFKELEVIP